MPELLIRPTAGAGYEEGDIIGAYNRRSIREKHAQNLCHPWKNGVSPYGLRISGSIVEDWYRHTCGRKYEIISPTQLRRTDLDTMYSVVLSEIPIEDPNRPGRYIRTNVAKFMERQLASRAPDGGPKLALFGTPGAEYWYGYRQDFSSTKLDLVWADIENKTPYREVDFAQWPCSYDVLCSFLIISVNDFDDTTAAELVSTLWDLTSPSEPVIAKKRKSFIQWQDKLALSQPAKDQILNRYTAVDIREAGTFERDLIVQAKILS